MKCDERTVNFSGYWVIICGRETRDEGTSVKIDSRSNWRVAYRFSTVSLFSRLLLTS